MKIQKKYFGALIIFTFLAAHSLYSEGFFEGLAGFGTGFAYEKTPTNTNWGVPIDASIASQFNFSQNIILRLGFDLRSNGLAQGEIFTGKDTIFKVNEISLLFTKRSIVSTHYFAFFAGNFEPIGSSFNFQRYLGVQDTNSLLTTTQTGIQDSPIYDFNGMGFAYTTRYTAPVTTGFSIYLNNEDSDTKKLNIDFKTTFAFDTIRFDGMVGIAAPLENHYSSSDVILLIDTIYLHGGLNMLLGNNDTHGFLLQTGIEDLPIKSGTNAKKFSLENLYFLGEVRIHSKYVKVRVTGFNLSDSKIENMLYINDNVGAALTVFTDAIPLKNNDMTLGINFIAGLEDSNLYSLISKSSETLKINAYVSPFIKANAFDGELEAMAEVALKGIPSTANLGLKFNVLYKKSF